MRGSGLSSSLPRPGGVVLAALAVALCSRAVPIGAASPPLSLEARVSGSQVSVSGAIPRGQDADALGQAVLEALRGGMRSEMVVQLRLYERERGIAGLLGDRLLREAVIVRTAHRDPFDGLLVMDERVDGLDRPPRALADEGALLEALFRIQEVGILRLPERPRGDLYLAARYRLSPIQLSGSLRIVSLFFDVGIRTSEWSRVAGIGEDT